MCKQHRLATVFLSVVYALLYSSQAFSLDTDQTEITADQVKGIGQQEVNASGDVVVRRNDQILSSDWLKYIQKDNRALAGDQFELKQLDQVTKKQETVICGSTLDYYLDQKTGEASKTTFESEKNGERVQGSGEKIYFLGNNQYRMDDSTLNTCQPGDSSWYIKARKIDLNRDTNVGVAHDAKLVFKGVPILYTPWIDFPLNNGRKSGFLTPTFSFGQDGFFEIPYYFNIAPNYDATIMPRIIPSRGLMLGGQFRYLQKNFNGVMAGQYLIHDKKTKEDRYLWSLKHQHSFEQLPFKLNGGVDFTQVSDRKYFRDFGNRLDIAENVNLNRAAWLNSSFALGPGHATTWFQVQKYQTLQNDMHTRDIPYAKLPELRFNYSQNIIQANFSLNTEFTRFHAQNKQNGNRFIAYPSMAWDMNKSWGFFRPKIGLHMTYYDLDSYNHLRATDETRILPIASVDSGLFFERNSIFLNKAHTQTIEPRLFYVYIPSKQQNDLPNFDSSENDFNFSQLFRENRFSGQDRINGANQVTTALTTRYLSDENGLERFKFMFGQRFYFSKKELSLSGTVKNRDKMGSDSLVEIGGDLNKRLRVDSFYHYNNALDKTERFSSSLHYHPDSGKIMSLRYLYDREEEIYSGVYGKVSQVDFGVQWPINNKYTLFVRENYSFADKMSLEQMLGLEYRDDCWRLRVVGQRYVTDKNKRKNAIFVQLELGNLGGLGNDPYDMLRMAIPGYSKNNEVMR